MVRWLVMCAGGVLAVHRCFVITMWCTPSVASASAAAAPAGPLPITRTSVSRSPPADVPSWACGA
jgi:hypothetical protein